MSNKGLATINQFSDVVSSMDVGQIELLQAQLYQRKFDIVFKQINELRDSQEKMKEEMAIKDLEYEQLRDVELKRHRVTEHRYGFVSANDLGQCFQVSIGSKTMGKLLRLVGLAKSKQSKTEPLRSAFLSESAKSVMYGDHPTYQWNPEKCINKIDKWLEKNGIVDEFYAIEDESKLTKYINKLANKYSEV